MRVEVRMVRTANWTVMQRISGLLILASIQGVSFCVTSVRNRNYSQNRLYSVYSFFSWSRKERSMSRAKTDRLPIFWLLILVTAASTLTLCAVNSLWLEFFTHDAEVELLAIRSIVDSGFQRVSIPWTQAYELFREELVPFGENFLAVYDDRLYASRPLLFLLLSAAMYGVLGVAGLYLLPLIAALGSVHLGYRVAQSLPVPATSRVSPVLVVPLLAFTTPILFYGLCFWNMIVGAVASTWAVYLLLKKETRYAGLVAGLVFGLGVGIRPDLSVLAILIVLWSLQQFGRRQTGKFLVGLGLAAILVCGLNYAVFGSLWGPHLAGNQEPMSSWLASRPYTLYDLFVTSLAGHVLEGIAVGAGILAMLPSGIGFVGRRFRAVMLWVFALASGWIALKTLVSPHPFESTLSTHSLLACSPFLFFVFFFSSKEDSRNRSLRWLALAYLLLTSLLCPPQAAQAAHWGPRIFVGFLPVVGVMAYFGGVEYLGAFRGRWVRSAIWALLLVSLVNQAFSLKLLYYKKHESLVFKEQMRRDELPIISGEWVIPADLASWYPHRALWLAENTTDLERIFQNLQATGQSKILALVREGSPLDLDMQSLAQARLLRQEARQPIQSRLFYYSDMKAVVYRLAW